MRELLTKILKATEGKIFSVVFIKKDGSKRKMQCRLGVKKHLRGGERAYVPEDFGLLGVFDMEKKGYRMVNLETLMSFTVDGMKYLVKNGAILKADEA